MSLTELSRHLKQKLYSVSYAALVGANLQIGAAQQKMWSLELKLKTARYHVKLLYTNRSHPTGYADRVGGQFTYGSTQINTLSTNYLI